MKGKKTGGRQKGTRNKRTQDVIDRLEALGCDPIEGMAQIAMDETNSAELRGRMYAELAQYVAPKLKAIEHSGGLETPRYVARVPLGRLSVEEWEQMHRPLNGSGEAH
jgi:hypothetical protein